MNTTITLFRYGGFWQARYTGRGAAHIKEAFGTDTLPTAFGAAMEASEAVARIRELNPDAQVVLKVSA